MSLQDIIIKEEYRSFRDDVVNEFYIPVLKESVLYKRAVGFFSSTALIEISKGISGLIRNRGTIKLIVSPVLQAEDVDAITKGYAAKEIVETAIMREFIEPSTKSDEERLNWLATLISQDKLEIKVAFTTTTATGLYHEKMGIIYDADFNRIAFSGSMNETINAFRNNYETIDTFFSWNEHDINRIARKEEAFDYLWNNQEKNIEVIDFPKVAKEKFKTYQKENINLEIDQPFNECAKKDFGIPKIPNGVRLHDYQEEAITNWKNNNFSGIFDMATGTGKTYTGLAAALELFNGINRLALIIVCPYQHLVEQWVEDMVKFNMDPVIGYSASKQKNWKERLSDEILDYNIKISNFFCFITTNATYSSDFIDEQIRNIKGDVLIIVDEAHNFGATNLSKHMLPQIKFRLALSATLDRHNDDVGTRKLYDYFGKKCIEYKLERAIQEKKLTPYYYYPKAVYLTDDELDSYRHLSKKISKCCWYNKSGKLDINEQGKRLLIQRARLVAGAFNKLQLLRELIAKYRNDSHILVYCGATRIMDPNKDESEEDLDGERQIVAVSKMLGNELGMAVTHFTSKESVQDREKIKTEFANVDPYQVLVAIKCLDEGVNIPSIKIAFILASSTNPKEYIQRRGRVLRTASNKPYAIIYDFITLPRPTDSVTLFDCDEVSMDLSLVKKEIKRMKEFGYISKNPSDTDKMINSLVEAYNLDLNAEGGWDDEEL
jgi:superfamily II DNA or RNA helicase